MNRVFAHFITISFLTLFFCVSIMPGISMAGMNHEATMNHSLNMEKTSDCHGQKASKSHEEACDDCMNSLSLFIKEKVKTSNISLYMPIQYVSHIFDSNTITLLNTKSEYIAYSHGPPRRMLFSVIQFEIQMLV